MLAFVVVALVLLSEAKDEQQKKASATHVYLHSIDKDKFSSVPADRSPLCSVYA